MIEQRRASSKPLPLSNCKGGVTAAWPGECLRWNEFVEREICHLVRTC